MRQRARRQCGIPLHGWLIIDKDEGPSSAAVAARAKRLFNAAKVGHGGTLDPLASGILPLAFGEATKTVSFALSGPKRYLFTIRWGEATTTDDREGAVIERCDHRPDVAAIQNALARFTGRIAQRPPAFSAIKHHGKRAYALARAGHDITLEERVVTVEEFAFLGDDGPDQARFSVACGPGVYIRSLARDLSLCLGTVGHVARLRRVSVGRFDTRHAIALDSLETLGHSAPSSAWLLPIAAVLDDIPALAVSGAEAKLIRAGQSVIPVADAAFGASCLPGVPVCALCDRQPVALGQWDGGRFVPRRVFNL